MKNLKPGDLIRIKINPSINEYYELWDEEFEDCLKLESILPAGEKTGYVTVMYLNSLKKQVYGFGYSEWYKILYNSQIWHMNSQICSFKPYDSFDRK